MKKLLIATKNKGKLKELAAFLSDLPLEIVSLTDVNITDDVEEDGKTYEENSKKKALYYAKLSGLPALSDDGGLEIAALGHAPGVRSKRWIGENATEDDLVAHMEKVAAELPDDNRDASFVNVIAFAMPDGRTWITGGRIDGVIAKKKFEANSIGLPYRLFFFLPDLQKYYHEQSLTPTEMERRNHRRKSVEEMKSTLKAQLSLSD